MGRRSLWPRWVQRVDQVFAVGAQRLDSGRSTDSTTSQYSLLRLNCHAISFQFVRVAPSPIPLPAGLHIDEAFCDLWMTVPYSSSLWITSSLPQQCEPRDATVALSAMKKRAA